MQIVQELDGGPLVLSLPLFADDRGSFSVTYESTAAHRLGLPATFVQDNHSISAQVGTIRGIHLQLPPHEQGKLVRVLRGRILDVMVDLRPDSPQVGHCQAVELAAGDSQAVWIPPGFGHAFCTLEEHTEVFYKVDAAYAPHAELSLAWDDPELGIDWPVAAEQIVLSDKDRQGVGLTEALERIASALAGATSTNGGG